MEHAEKAIRILQEIFSSLHLDINDEKTFVNKSPHFFDNGWSSVLSNYKFSSDQKKQLYDLIRYFDISYRYSIDFPLDSVLKYAIKRLNNVNIESGNWSHFESLLMKTAITEPATLHEFSAIMYKNKRIVDNKKIKEIIFTLLEEHIYKGHSYEINWALWLSKVFNIQIPDKIASNLFNLVDASNLIMALDLKNRGLISSTIITDNIVDLIDENALQDEYWLLAYEADYHGWLTLKHPDLINNHPFFSILKKNNISFYHSSKVFYHKPASSTLAHKNTRTENQQAENKTHGQPEEKDLFSLLSNDY
ncbi:hypothetical protein [Hymenobacter sp. CRA2]|uniref:hypothetical protein n=1 Tax=Hymenobacter sp. CRA2 TaxID=1955620 RepID=UPI001116FDE5|nr:hypothetical protein [Hymenobacter sp. CRA2]